jgi:hypothetical protein
MVISYIYSKIYKWGVKVMKNSQSFQSFKEFYKRPLRFKKVWEFFITLTPNQNIGK